MEQKLRNVSISKHSIPYPSLAEKFNEVEMEVTEIIVDLRNLIPPVSVSSNCSLSSSLSCWGLKRRRSAIGSIPSPAAAVVRASPPSSPVPQVDNEKERAAEVKPNANSPGTPLSFPPSEDEKQKHPPAKKLKKKLTREKCLKTCQTLTECKVSLQQFTARSCLEEDKPQLGMINESLNLQTEQHPSTKPEVHQQHYPLPPVSTATTHHRNQLSLVNQTVAYGYGCSRTSLVGNFGVANQIVPVRGIPDLNVSVEESFPLNFSLERLDVSKSLLYDRAKAAGARKNRMLRIKENRNSIAARKNTRG